MPPGFSWAYWAHVLYILGMFGYLTVDTLIYVSTPLDTTRFTFAYICLAMIFIVDAILYTIDWYMYAVKLRENPEEPVHYRAEFVACIFHNLGSWFYMTGALLAVDKVRYMTSFLVCNLIGNGAFLLEAGLVYLGWFISMKRRWSLSQKRSCTMQVRTDSSSANA